MERINRVKEMLECQGKSEEWLAENLHRSVSCIASFCGNQSQPDLTDLKKIAELLDIDIRELLFPTKDPKQKNEMQNIKTPRWNVVSTNSFFLNPHASPLTKRERELLHWIADGWSTKEISGKVCSSKNTIAQHRKNMLRKTNSKNVAELIRYAITNGIIR